MNPTYRNVAIAAGGALAVAVAARILQSRHHAARAMTAQTMTVLLEREQVIERLDDRTIQTAVGCEDLRIVRDASDSRLIEWTCETHASEDARLALIAAPHHRGTELHIAMRGKKYHAKELVRRLKMLLEAGELATGARQ